MPISIELWLAFAAAAAIMIMIPGPTTLMVLGHTVSNGWRIGLTSLIGVVAADICAITLSVLGFSALLAASAMAFTVMKWIGAAYLVWIGIQLWRAPPMNIKLGDLTPTAEKRTTPRDAIAQTFIVTLLNPKGILFFAAFLPQFIDQAMPLWPQVIVLMLTFCTLATLIQGFYITLMGRARSRIASPRALRLMNRTGGVMLIGAGLLTASLKKA